MVLPRGVVEENETQMGERWRKMGEKWDISPRPIFPILPEVEDLPLSSLCKDQLTALTDGKMGIVATHRHSPPAQKDRHFAVTILRYLYSGAGDGMGVGGIKAHKRPEDRRCKAGAGGL